jgi:hypothetical protein
MMIRVLLAIVIVAAAVMSGVYINQYINQSMAVEVIKEQIANGKRNLALLEDKTAKVNAEVAGSSSAVETSRAEIASAQSVVPEIQIDTNDIVRQILSLGKSNRVDVTVLTTQDWTLVKGQDYQCQSTTLNLEAAGTQSDVITFIKLLPGLYSTLVIDKMTVSRIQPTPVKDAPPEGNYPASERLAANLALVIYTR